MVRKDPSEDHLHKGHLEHDLKWRPEPMETSIIFRGKSQLKLWIQLTKYTKSLFKGSKGLVKYVQLLCWKGVQKDDSVSKH